MSAPSRERRPTAIGAFVFAGGFTLGVRQHFDVVAHLEERMDLGGGRTRCYAVETQRLNFPDVPTHVGHHAWPLDELARAHPDLDFLMGNCPCALFSSMGRGAGRGNERWRDDPRLAHILRHFGLIERLLPKVWAWESVTQAYDAEELREELEQAALSLGYSTTHLLLDARWLGVPQRRQRYFMLCHRVVLDVPQPDWSPPITVGEALAGLIPIGKPRDEMVPAALRDKLHMLAPGEQLTDLFDRLYPNAPKNARGKVEGRPSFGNYRLRLDQPAPAVVGKSFIHPTEDRCLTINETARLSGFPSRFRFAPGGTDAQAREISRGVCPPVGEWLARIVAAAVERDAPANEARVRTVDIREPPASKATIPEAAE